MEYKIRRSEDRGGANHVWLNAKHSFSFASYYNPENLQFGALRVLNDDKIAPNMGFNEHPHDNMEIITIPLQGQLTHKDSMGNSGTISAEEIQVMSAGSGVRHSEKNSSKIEELQLFQIWIEPDTRNIEPRYGQIKIDDFKKKNKIVKLVGPKTDNVPLWIQQNAWISILNLEKENSIQLKPNDAENGLFLMIIEGEIKLDTEILNNRDSIEIEGCENCFIEANEDSKILLIEVPLV